MAPAFKKRKVVPVEEISFDEAAREQYLTGFHKRKQQRIKQAQEEAAKREQDERIKERKEMRKRRRQQLEEHVEAVNSMLRNINGHADINEEDANDVPEPNGGEEWAGFEEPPEINRVDEYIDEDKYATVTVESVHVAKDGLHVAMEENDGDNDDDEDDQVADSDPEEKDRERDTSNGKLQKKRIWTKEKPAGNKPKKRKKFRYESAAERKVTRQKQKARNSKAAKARRG
ncbi:hypothetical protein EV356DRAFT_510526 [Viridothelium virens]|uniref:Protein required for cell viability Rrp17 n=1 Tax=Viridothelium virens TaxID=1048519 RepID=A0A6A6HI70_VIRVR|nr:hypothetical protein EV356DRAFT_510526 [Viridothelium virens]